MPDLSESHLFGHGFDPDVCEGCPHKTTDAEGGLLGALADALGEDKCGLCGCPLSNLSAFQAPPESCIRLPQHRNGGER